MLTSERDFIRWIAAEFKRMDVGGETPIDGSAAVEWMNDTYQALRSEFPALSGGRGTPLEALGAVIREYDGHAYWLDGDYLMAAPRFDDGSIDRTAEMPVREFAEPLADVTVADLVCRIMAARVTAEVAPDAAEAIPTLEEAVKAVLDACEEGDIKPLTDAADDAMTKLDKAFDAARSGSDPGIPC
jgi:hypothetical protein